MMLDQPLGVQGDQAQLLLASLSPPISGKEWKLERQSSIFTASFHSQHEGLFGVQGSSLKGKEGSFSNLS